MKWSLPWSRRPLGDRPSSPSGVVHELLMPRVSRAVRPTVRTGFLGEWTGFPALSRADGGGNGRRSVPLAGSRDCTDSDQTRGNPTTCANSTTFTRPDPNRTAPEQNRRTNRTDQRKTPSFLLASRTRQSGDDTPPLPLPLLTSVERGMSFRRDGLRGSFGPEILRGRFGRKILARGCCRCHAAPPSAPRRS